MGSSEHDAIIQEQLSLWELFESRKAVCCADGQTAAFERPEPWMLELVPRGEHVVFVAGKPFVLSRTDACSGEVKEGNTIFNRVKKAEGQAHRFIIDVTHSGLDDAVINKQLEKLFARSDTEWVEEVFIIRGNAIFRIMKRA